MQHDPLMLRTKAVQSPIPGTNINEGNGACMLNAVITVKMVQARIEPQNAPSQPSTLLVRLMGEHCRDTSGALGRSCSTPDLHSCDSPAHLVRHGICKLVSKHSADGDVLDERSRHGIAASQPQYVHMTVVSGESSGGCYVSYCTRCYGARAWDCSIRVRLVLES